MNVVGSTCRAASRPFGSARDASIMKTASASTIPTLASAHAPRASVAPSPACVASVPHRTITSAILTGATTGPHQGSGSRNRMSHSKSVGMNSRMRWTYKPLGDLFVIYNHNVRSIEDRWQLDSNQLIVKFQYTFRY